MTTDLQLVAGAAMLTWLMVLVAALLSIRVWSPEGRAVGLGNRAEMPKPAPWIARAQRASKNMLESFPLFVALVAVAHLGNRHGDRVDLGAQVFFWARVVYWPIYLAGIPHVRTLIWGVSIAGLGLIFSAVV